MKFESEIEVAQSVVEWLESDGWEVYKEVELTKSGKCADIVAHKDGEYKIIETKMSLTQDVCKQAHNRQKFCRDTYIATPNNNSNYVIDYFCGSTGIGRLVVGNYGCLTPWSYHRNKKWKLISKNGIRVYIESNPDKNILYKKFNLEKKLHPLQRESIAGTNMGGQITPFKLTIINIKEYLKENGPSEMKTIVKNIDHHYKNNSSANSSLVAAFNSFLDLEFSIRGKKWYIRG